MIVHKEMAERDNELLYRVIFENTLDGLEIIDAETGRSLLRKGSSSNNEMTARTRAEMSQ